MKQEKIKSVFEEFMPIEADFSVKTLTSGHINHTYLVTNSEQRFILQEINTSIFKSANEVMENIRKVSEHLHRKDYPHKILKPLDFKNGELLFDGNWRLFEFMENTQTFEKVQSAQQAFKAAEFLGEFHLYLKDLKATEIKDSISGFLDFNSRIEQFETALKSASEERKKECKSEINLVLENRQLLDKWNDLLAQTLQRIVHADPKISNFLFDKDNPEKIISLIDWDTLMTGSILYDFGDMARSYTNLREEDDPEKGNNFSSENYKALKEGFLVNLKDELTEEELSGLDLAAQTVIYIQAVRFLTDYLNGDIYYAIHYPGQNLNRAKNQLNLLTELKDLIGKDLTGFRNL